MVALFGPDSTSKMADGQTRDLYGSGSGVGVAFHFRPEKLPWDQKANYTIALIRAAAATW